MNTSRPNAKLRRSQSVVLILSGALATTMGPAGCSDHPEPPLPPAPGSVSSADILVDGVDQQNNTYVAGVGYYHSISHTFYPYPFNWYYPGFGYYYRGGWHTSLYVGVVPTYSRPSSHVYAQARNMSRQYSLRQTHSAPTRSYSRPSVSSPATPKSSPIIRGGFGSSSGSHFGGS